MKRAGNLFPMILDRNNLRQAVASALNAKRGAVEPREFVANLDRNLEKLALDLGFGSFQCGPYRQFVIHDPKRRMITAPCFRDRVMHHAVTRICEPIFERWLIHDTYACRVGKGRESALARAMQFARRGGYFLKLDIRHYFDSIPHAVLLAKLRILFKDVQLLDLFDRIVQSYGVAPGLGLPIGSLTSQHFANFYLGWLDRQIKETFGIRRYVRYMDDMLLWSSNKDGLKQVLVELRDYLESKLGLELKANTYLNRVEHGVDFLGCRLFRGRMTLNRRSRVRLARRLSRLEREHAVGRLSDWDLQDRVTAMMAFARAAGVESWHWRDHVIRHRSVVGYQARTV